MISMPVPRYRASSVAADARAWLGRTSDARILNRFEHSCNLINGRREIVSIVAPEIGNGPFNIVIDSELPPLAWLDTTSPITVSPEELSIGFAVIDVGNAAIWSAAPDWVSLHAAKAQIVLHLVEAEPWIQARSPADSLLAMDSPEAQLSGAIVAADLAACEAAARRLAGAGPGLTPAGDDYILGATYAARIIHAPEVARAIGLTLASTSAPLTTSLSAAWLEAAARGGAAAVWHALFAASVLAEPAAFRASVGRLLMTGHTSGADSLAGLLATLETWAESEFEWCPSSRR